jgi:hypothetical protein
LRVGEGVGEGGVGVRLGVGPIRNVAPPLGDGDGEGVGTTRVMGAVLARLTTVPSLAVSCAATV